MSNKLFFSIACSLLSVIVLLSGFIPVSIAHADVMQWSIAETPGDNNNLIVSPSEVNSIALSSDGISFFATDIPHSKLYKSPNGGYSWTDISGNVAGAGASLPVWNIAVAPDNPSIIAAVTSSAGQPREVYISTSGGDNWHNLDFPLPQNIGSIDISGYYGAYDIAVGTRSGTGTGELMIYKMTGTGSWANQGFSGDILAIAFSPDYGNDNSISLAASTGSGTFAYIGIHDVNANATDFGTWGPVEITTAGAGTSPGATQIKTADIELPSDFSGQVGSNRKFFISINDAGASGNAGIYRIDDSIIYCILQASGNTMISSISYYGSTTSGKLLAGEVKANPSEATAGISYCLNAAASCPLASCLLWQKAIKPPTGGADTGNANAQVAWSNDGNRAYCGTSSADVNGSPWPNGYTVTQALDESAFSLSADNSATWNQIGLIDTQINYLSDVVATPASDALYLSSINTGAGNTGFDSIWRKTATSQVRTWERVYCLLSGSNETILRINPLNPAQVLLGISATTNLFESVNSGATWNNIIPGTNIVDLDITTIGSTPTIIILANGTTRTGEYTGTSWRWLPPANTGLNSGHTVSITPEGLVVVGDAGNGGVAFSMSAGMQYLDLPLLPVSGNTHVIIDPRVSEPYLIIAATDNPASSIYGWVVDKSTAWIDFQPPIKGYFGLAQPDTFYGCSFDGTGSAVARSLQPETLGMIEWDVMDAGLTAGVVFTREPSAFSVSAGSLLLAIDNRPYTSTSGRLWKYGDLLSGGSDSSVLPPPEVLLQAPTPLMPSENAVFNPDSSNNTPDIEFKWQQSTPANGYDLWIATDSDFNQIVLKKSIIPDNVMSPKWTLESRDSPLETGKTYYWKVRINRIAYTYQKVNGNWSKVSVFKVAGGTKQTVELTVPELEYPAYKATVTDTSPIFQWSPVAGATEYEFTLAGDEEMQQLLVSAKVREPAYRYTDTLKRGETYYWQVKVTQPDTGKPSEKFSFTVSEISQTRGNEATLPVWVFVLGAAVVLVTIILLLLIFRRRN